VIEDDVSNLKIRNQAEANFKKDNGNTEEYQEQYVDGVDFEPIW